MWFEIEQGRGKELEKLWDGQIFFNSYSSNQRGLVILFKNSLPAKDIKINNILNGDYTRLTFTVMAQKILIKCIYAPNDDMTTNKVDNYSNTFFKTVFDDGDNLDFDIKLTL